MIEDVDQLAAEPQNASAEPPEVIPPLDLMIKDQPVKKKGKYIKKRCREEAALQASDWKAVPDTVVHPPKPNILRSPVYEHIEFQQLKADPNVFQAASKLCRAKIKIDTAWGYNKHFHPKKDYAHEIICKYMDVVKAKTTYPGIRSAILVHKYTKEALVEWLIDTFVAPHCIMNESWDAFMAKIDDTIARITYEQLYRIMDDIKERHYTHIKKMIAEEVQSLGKRCRHFHV